MAHSASILGPVKQEIGPPSTEATTIRYAGSSPLSRWFWPQVDGCISPMKWLAVANTSCGPEKSSSCAPSYPRKTIVC